MTAESPALPAGIDVIDLIPPPLGRGPIPDAPIYERLQWALTNVGTPVYDQLLAELTPPADGDEESPDAAAKNSAPAES